MSQATIAYDDPINEAGSTDFLARILAEQSDLTAVEQFSVLHEADAEPAQSRYYKSLLPATAPGPDQQYSFEVDLDACSGCKACVVACHTLNGLEDDESWRRVGTITIGGELQSDPIATIELPQIKHVTTACHHCTDPGCLTGCPVKAYHKDPLTGIVKHLDDQCIGCKYCMMMCPYEVPKYSKRLGIVRKCDMCQQRLSVGEAPACVQSCPNEAIAIRIVETKSNFSSSDRLSPGAPLSSITKPTTRYIGIDQQALQNSKPQDDQIDHPSESHWPLAIMLVATEAAVGILIFERIVSLLSFVTFGNGLATATTFACALTAFAIASIGMAIAPLHLGQPSRAWKVFLGLRTSWLSREAVLLGNFMGALGTAVALLGLAPFAKYVPTMVADSVPSWAAKLTLSFAILFGVAGLLSSAMIYIATKRQLWIARRTMFRFIGTAVVVGAVGSGTILVAVRQLGFGEHPLFASLLLVIGSIALAGKLHWENKILIGGDRLHDSAYDRRSRRLVHGPLVRLVSIRRTAGLVAATLACLAGLIIYFAPEPLTLALSVAGLLAALIGECAERLIYFSSVVHDRMPGVIA